MLHSNFHTHSTYCDGIHTPGEIAEYARSLGMRKLGFSGHMDPIVSMDLPAYLREIRSLQKQYSGCLEIFAGVETDYYSVPFAREGLDYVIGSTHLLGGSGAAPTAVDLDPEMTLRLCRECYGSDGYRMAKAYYELEAGIWEKTGCTFIGHFDLITRFNDTLRIVDENDPRYLGPATEAMEYLVSRDLPFELNAGAVNRGRKEDFYPNRTLLRRLRELGGEILLNSDAHRKELLLGELDRAAETAKSCGFDHALELKRNADGSIGFSEVPLE